MDLFIQMGHGMQSLALELLGSGDAETFILSPLNSTPDRLIKFGQSVSRMNGKSLLDPQLYCPRKYHKNLAQYSYWPQDSKTLFESGNCDSVIEPLAQLNAAINSKAFILPSSIVRNTDERWNFIQKCIIESARKYSPHSELLHTIALTSDVLMDEAQVQSILAFAETWDVPGIYIVCEHPAHYYLVDKPLWVSNLLDLVSGLKRQNKQVIVGYASHQLLCLSLAKCDAIAAGNFLNVRWFQPEHFETTENEDISRRAVWYYCPQALSEFKIPFLDIAKRMNLLDRLAPSADMMDVYCEMLFGTALPSSTGYGEKQSHRHYLCSLRHQCQSAVRTSYSETKAAHLLLLETAEHLLSGLREKGIKGQDRDFAEIIDVNRAAIAALDMAYGFALSKEWDSI